MLPSQNAGGRAFTARCPALHSASCIRCMAGRDHCLQCCVSPARLLEGLQCGQVQLVVLPCDQHLEQR